jgi:hypothetical protein
VALKALVFTTRLNVTCFLLLKCILLLTCILLFTCIFAGNIRDVALKALFEKFDEDRSGSIDKEELRKMAKVNNNVPCK